MTGSLLFSALVGTALAQTPTDDAALAPEVDAHTFQLSIDSDAAFFTDDAGTVLNKPLVRGRVGFHGVLNPRVSAYDPEVGFESLTPVRSLAQIEINQVVHINRVRLGVDLPLWTGAWADGQSLDPVISEIGLDGRVTVLDPDRRTLGLALGLRGGIPTLMSERTLPGAARRRFLQPDLVLQHNSGIFTGVVDLGYRWVSKEATPGVVWGDHLTFNAAVGMDLGAEDAHVSAELASGYLFRNPEVLPGGAREGKTWAELIVGGWRRISGPVYIEMFVGASPQPALGSPTLRGYIGLAAHPERDGAKDADDDGIVDLVDGCDLEPEDVDGFEDFDGCPEPDNDLDGVLDADDQCPLEAEDLDGFRDGDGCPDLDNDRDGLPDTEDECPDEAEDRDGYQDSDGCPDPSARVVVEVADPRGNFLSSATVSVRGNGLALEGDSGDLFNLHDARYTVRAELPEWRPAQAVLDIEAERQSRRFVTLTLEPIDRKGRVRVRVLTPEGELVEGAEVTVVDTEIGGLTDAGSVRLDDVPEGAAVVEVRASGYGVASLPVDVVWQRTADLEVTLQPAQAVLIGGRIEIRDSVYFETASATIQEVSYPLLDDVALIIQDNPLAEMVQIEGHTDARGSASYNKDLSERRAASVRQYLIDAGIEADRLVSKGFGEEYPIDPREEPEAYDLNRRVDFYILRWEGEDIDVDAEREKVRLEAMGADEDELAPDEATEEEE